MPDTFKKYKEDIVPALKKKLDYKNSMEVPRLEKIVLSTGIGADKDKNVFNDAKQQMSLITGQMPVITKAKKNVANFKLRAGMPVGARVTLRKSMMYDFIDRLVHNTLPRVRDFRGISSKGFDGRGNYNMGLQDVTVFTEVDPDKLKNQFGLNITIVTTAETDKEAYELLKLFEMPFKEN